MARFRFQELEVWQQAIQFADLIYEQTGRFPSEEKFGLSSQLRRAAVSISSNIAEGNGRPSNTEYARFVEIAYSSLMEVVSQLHIAQLRNYLTQHCARVQGLCYIIGTLGRQRSSFWPKG